MKRICSLIFCIIMGLICVCSIGCGPTQNNSENTLVVKVLNRGYGDKFVKELGKAYTEKTGIQFDISSTPMSSKIESELQAGPKINDTDLYVWIGNIQKVLKEGKAYSNGWNDLALADLSDIYETVPEGYDTDKKLKDAMLPYALQAAQFEGKEYGISWATALEGMIYNEELMIEFFGENYHTPRTTDEMFDMFKTIANGGDYTVKKYSGKEQTYSIYPFIYPGQNDYMQYIFLALWAQYDGIDSYYNMLKGQDNNGNYTADIFATDGRYEALSIVHDMITVGDLNRPKYDGYVSPDARNFTFTSAQVKFLEGEAVFAVTGDWIEREMESNFTETRNIKFMKLPVISSIISNIPEGTIKNDEQLREVVEYVDNGGSTSFESALYSGVRYSEADVKYITTARSIYNCEAENHMCIIPAYSDKVDIAKDFLKFMLSKEGQEIQMRYSYGNCVPMSIIPYDDFDVYGSLSTFAKSKFNTIQNVEYVGRLYNQPICYKGGMTIVNFSSGFSLEGAFGITTSSASYRDPNGLFDIDVETAKIKMKQWLANAALSN